MLMLSIQQTVTLLRLLSISMVKGLALSVTIGYQATHSRFKHIYNFFSNSNRTLGRSLYTLVTPFVTMVSISLSHTIGV